MANHFRLERHIGFVVLEVDSHGEWTPRGVHSREVVLSLQAISRGDYTLRDVAMFLKEALAGTKIAQQFSEDTGIRVAVHVGTALEV